MITMFRSVRLIVLLSVLGVISVGAIVGWLTGFFGQVAGRVGELWSGFIGWVSQPIDWSHMAAGGGVLVACGIAIALILALTDS